MLKPIILGLAVGLQISPALAQQAIGSLASTCEVLGSDRQITLSSAIAVPANAMVLASIASNSDQLSDFSVGDGSSQTYIAAVGQFARQDKVGLAQLYVIKNAALPSASALTIRAEQGPDTAVVCVRLHAYRDIAQLRPNGASYQRQENASSITTSFERGPANTPDMILGAVAFTGNPGTVSTSPSAQVTPAICSGNFCLSISEEVTNLPNAAVTVNSNAVNSNLVAAGFMRDSFFRNGWE